MFESLFTRDEQRLCSERVQVWRGKSGRRYVHTVYPSNACPEVENAIYLAVGRDGSGARRPVAIDGGRSFFPSDGTEEVHVHLLASCGHQAARVMDDLRAEYGLAAN